VGTPNKKPPEAVAFLFGIAAGAAEPRRVRPALRPWGGARRTPARAVPRKNEGRANRPQASREQSPWGRRSWAGIRADAPRPIFHPSV